jgi:hypothetical protein
MMALVVLFESASCAYLFHGTSDQVTINSGDPNTTIFLDDQLIGRGNASATLERGKTYTIVGKDPGCTEATVTTGDKFDPTSLLGLFIDLGLISILVIDMAATDAAWKTYPLSYTVNPICPAVASPSGSPPPAARPAATAAPTPAPQEG